LHLVKVKTDLLHWIEILCNTMPPSAIPFILADYYK